MADDHHVQGATAEEIKTGKGMAVLSYIIALIPFFAGDKKNKYVRFHAVQGMNILIASLIVWVISWIVTAIVSAIVIGSAMTLNAAGTVGSLGILTILGAVFGIISLLIGILDIIGLVYAAQGKMKEVPIFNKLKFIKK